MELYTCAVLLRITREATEIDNDLEDPTAAKPRVLDVTYPDNMHTHCKVQKYYFDSKYVLRRLDYTADVTGGMPVAHYLFDHRKVDGLLLPMLRRAVRDPEGIEAGGESAVSLNFHDVKVLYESRV